MLTSNCLLNPIISDWRWFIALGIPLLELITVLILLILESRKVQRLLGKIVLLVVGMLFGLFIAYVSFVFLFIFLLEEYDKPIASNYFAVNAAIKNTCFLDPNRVHCPKTFEEIIAIEPQRFNDLLKGKTVAYNYNPENNNYTLFVLNDNNRGVIFDPNFKQRNENGYDFLDIHVNSCNISDMPDIYESSNNQSAELREYLYSVWKSLHFKTY